MAISLDGSATGTTPGGSAAASVSATLTTSNVNDVIVACIVQEQLTASGVTVGSVTAAGLTFTHRGSKTVVNGSSTYDVEVWWAPSTGALSSKVITANASSSTFDGATLVVFGVTGANNISSPWDSNASLPYSGNATTAGTYESTVNTSQAHDFIFMVLGSRGATTGTFHGVTTGLVSNLGVSGGSFLNVTQSVNYEIVSAIQSGATIGQSGDVNATVAAWLIDAITGDASGQTSTISQAFRGIQHFGLLNETAHQTGSITQTFSGIAQTNQVQVNAPNADPTFAGVRLTFVGDQG